MSESLELCHCAFEADYKPMTKIVIQFIYPYIPIYPRMHVTVLLCSILLIVSTITVT